MIELADIFRQYGHGYIRRFASTIPHSHLRVMDEIIRCRTQTLGGMVFYCEHCQEYHYSYHSCGNRHCNKCQNDRAQQWLEEKKNMLLPVSHFLVTFTLHNSLRRVARSHQKLCYHLMFKCAAEALQTLAQDFKYLGGQIGMLGILHTWGRDLCYHPHVHFIVPGIAYFKDGDALLFASDNFLVPVKALSIIFRAKFQDALKQKDKILFDSIDSNVWREDWVVHSDNVGTGEAAFKYLANYVFRVAISNNRILSMNDGKVSFKYQQSETQQWKIMTLQVFEFMRRFLQHVLPAGFVKVRYYGFWAAANKNILQRIKELLAIKEQDDSPAEKIKKPELIRCPTCGKEMVFVAEVKPGARWPHAPPLHKYQSGNMINGVHF
ncbi:MAG: transposase [Aliifodinibius sp.]|nr:transposase [Fodinibius sp.]NIW46565.1 transposase [Gammaproteobacteria bacterium]NIX57762.1 transposase [candidate division Zixibacteria bacterium]NIY27702.1 transposase [Fodinibius sp.]